MIQEVNDITGGFAPDVSEREGNRIAVVLFDEVRVFHRPHLSPDMDRGAITSIRKWFEQHGVAR